MSSPTVDTEVEMFTALAPSAVAGLGLALATNSWAQQVEGSVDGGPAVSPADYRKTIFLQFGPNG